MDKLLLATSADGRAAVWLLPPPPWPQGDDVTGPGPAWSAGLELTQGAAGVLPLEAPAGCPAPTAAAVSDDRQLVVLLVERVALVYRPDKAAAAVVAVALPEKGIAATIATASRSDDQRYVLIVRLPDYEKQYNVSLLV